MPAFAPLTEAALPRAAALSALIGWNQLPADWAVFLRHGGVRVLDDGAEPLAATAAILPYGDRVGWIGMVLVRPDRRGAGLATALVRWAIDALRAAGVRSIALDATPAGEPVYARLGFRPVERLSRWRLPYRLPAGAQPTWRAATGAARTADLAGFGAPRAWLLRAFAARLPDAALATAGGLLLGRDGRTAPQLGPLLARDEPAARALLAAAPGGAMLDLRDHATASAEWLAAHGAVRERGFTRMVLGDDLPGDPSAMPVVAGPEFG